MPENRRPSGGTRSRRPVGRGRSGPQEDREQSQNAPEKDPVDDARDELEDEGTERSVDARSSEAPVQASGQRHNAHPQDEEPMNGHRDEAQQDEYEDPYDAQPSYLGRQAEVESQPSDEYLIETHFDRELGHFTGSILEFPELKAQGANREVVMTDLEAQLGQRLESLRNSGGSAPEPMSEKQYPETLELRLSQSLYRKLDRLSRFEKIEIDRLVGELLTRSLERRTEPPRGDHRRPQSQGGQQHHSRHSGGGHRHQNRRGGGGGQNRGRGGYNNTNQSGENFMEYVRNLESRGGSSGGGGNWRKK